MWCSALCLGTLSSASGAELCSNSLLQSTSQLRPAPPPDEDLFMHPLPPEAAPPEGHPLIDVLKIVVVNDFHRPLAEASMGGLLRDPSFMASVRIVCVDDASLAWCSQTVARGSSCVRARQTFAAPSNFEEKDYTSLVWLKWHVCLQALQWSTVSSVFAMDADVAVLAPFDQYVSTSDADFMFAPEVAGYSGLNGGQLWFKRNERTIAYIRSVLVNDQVAWPLDQEFAWRALGPPLRWQALPEEHFVSLCWNRVGKANVTASTRTYHAACTLSRDDKLRVLSDVAQRFLLLAASAAPQGAGEGAR